MERAMTTWVDNVITAPDNELHCFWWQHRPVDRQKN